MTIQWWVPLLAMAGLWGPRCAGSVADLDSLMAIPEVAPDTLVAGVRLTVPLAISEVAPETLQAGNPDAVPFAVPRVAPDPFLAGAPGPRIHLPQFSSEPERGPTWKNRVLTALGGAVVGAGVGYFASQLAESDWKEGSGGGEVQRSTWAAVGGGVGFALGFSFPLTGASGPPGAGPSPGGREVLTAAEIREVAAANAFEAVRLLRPEWLVQRGQSAFYDPEGDNIRAFLDEMEMGGVEALAAVSTSVIESIRFIDAARATARWGGGYTQGVIQVITNQ